MFRASFQSRLVTLLPADQRNCRVKRTKLRSPPVFGAIWAACLSRVRPSSRHSVHCHCHWRTRSEIRMWQWRPPDQPAKHLRAELLTATTPCTTFRASRRMLPSYPPFDFVIAVPRARCSICGLPCTRDGACRKGIRPPTAHRYSWSGWPSWPGVLGRVHPPALSSASSQASIYIQRASHRLPFSHPLTRACCQSS